MTGDVERILEGIYALSPEERSRLLAELESAGLSPSASQQALPLSFTTEEMEGPADHVLVFDGGSQGNPGPGYGSYALARPGEKPSMVRLDFGREMTNNEAEYETLIAALHGLVEQIGSAQASPADASVEVRGDSALVINQIQGRWKTKDERMRALRNRSRQMLARFREYRLTLQERQESVRVLGH